MIETFEIKPFYNLVDYVLRKPEMFVGSRNLSLLRTYFSGYKMALMSHNIKDQDLEHFSSFDSFAQEELGENTTIGWPRLIDSMCNSESESFDLFVSLLEKHRLGYKSSEA